MSLGSHIVWRGDEGVVVHLDPLIMRTAPVRTYVPVVGDDYEVLGEVEGDHSVPSEVVSRIRRYLAREATPTGEGGK